LLALVLLALALPLALPAVAGPVVEAAVADILAVEYVRVTETGITEPLVAGSTLSVVHRLAFPGHVPVRFKSLSIGPVGPLTYFHSMLRFSKFTWRGSLSGYCSSPQLPRYWSHADGVEGSEGVKVPFLAEVGV
jgi:hypothetical protein